VFAIDTLSSEKICFLSSIALLSLMGDVNTNVHTCYSFNINTLPKLGFAVQKCVKWE